MTTIVNLPALPSVNLGDVLGVDQSPSGNFQTGKATVAQLLAKIPTASPQIPGLIQVGAGLTITNGILAATGGGTGGGPAYVLPTASSSVLGGVKVGNGLQIDSVGNLSTTGSQGTQYTLPIATTGVLGGIKPDGTTVTVNAITGILSVNSTVQGNNPTFTGDITSTSAGAGLSLGSTSVSGAPHVDFKSFGSPVAYDVRITATGGQNAVNGQGSLNILAAGGLQINGIAITPSAYAPLTSPAFTGTPTIIGTPPAANDSTTKVATTAFVASAVAAQVSSAAVVTSLQGDGSGALVKVDAQGAPSLLHDILFPPLAIPFGQIVANNIYNLIIPFACTIYQVNGQIYNAGGTPTTNNIILHIQKNGVDVPGLGAMQVSGAYGVYHPTSSTAFAPGDSVNYLVASITGSMGADAVLNVQLFGVYA